MVKRSDNFENGCTAACGVCYTVSDYLDVYYCVLLTKSFCAGEHYKVGLRL